MWNKINRLTANAAALLGLTLAASGIAAAQANPTATRTAEIDAFGGITVVNPDYGQKSNFGYTAGLAYNRTRYGMLAPGLEARFSGSSGNTVAENTYLAGLRFQAAPMFGAHPYMVALLGMGSISYSYNFTTRPSETDFVYGLGAGAEIPVRRNLRVRAEYLQQTWSYQPHNLTPMALTIGVSYTVLGGDTQVR